MATIVKSKRDDPSASFLLDLMDRLSNPSKSPGTAAWGLDKAMTPGTPMWWSQGMAPLGIKEMAATGIPAATAAAGDIRKLLALPEFIKAFREMAGAGNLGGGLGGEVADVIGTRAEPVVPEKTEVGGVDTEPPPRVSPTGINEPGSENWMKFSRRGEGPIATEYMQPMVGQQSAVEIMAQHANSGNRPSDILARQMFEKDKKLKQAFEMIASANPEYRKRGRELLDAYQTEEILRRDGETLGTKDALRELELQSKQVDIQKTGADIQKTGAETDYLKKQAEVAGTGEPFKDISDRIMSFGLLTSQIANAMAGGDPKRAQMIQQQVIISLLPKLLPELGELGIDFAVEE